MNCVYSCVANKCGLRLVQDELLNMHLTDTRSHNYFCIPITFNNPFKTYFSNKKYLITIKTRPTQISKVNFLLKNWFLTVSKDCCCTKSITCHFLFRFNAQQGLRLEIRPPHTLIFNL